jgi:DNA mismatch repair ATPase MutS
MKALLMHRDRDFDLNQPSPWNAADLTQDLDLDMLLRAMAGDDKFLFEVSRKTLLCGTQNDIDTVRYRQEGLKDCLQNEAVIRELYALVVETIERTKKETWGITSHYPSSMLYSATSLLEMLVVMLRKLRDTAAAHASQFKSDAFQTLFAMLAKELDNEYLAAVQDHLTVSQFRKGVLMSAQLGECNESANLVLRKAAPERKQKWFERFLRRRPPGYTFHLHERDEAGARIFGEIRHRAIGRVAVALAESADHVLSFFKMLRTELAFYVACTNLHATLLSKGQSVCFPEPVSAGERHHHFRNLYDVCLSLRIDGRIVANTMNGDGKNLVVITGANQGGKSSFLRSVGIAQLMMQCGMFVGAEVFEGELCSALLTHYKREEDATMQSGKFDEELARMNQIVEHVGPNATVLFNESFAATNEREGSEIASQIVTALLEKRIRVFYVTHLYEFARSSFERKREDAFFLRAERQPDGSRTFQLSAAEPLETSYGEDLYREIFEESEQSLSQQRNTTIPATAD